MMDAECEDGQLKDVQRLMEEQERASPEGSLEATLSPLMGRLVAGGDEPSDVEETPNKRAPVKLSFVSDIKGILGSVHPPSSLACGHAKIYAVAPLTARRTESKVRRQLAIDSWQLADGRWLRSC